MTEALRRLFGRAARWCFGIVCLVAVSSPRPALASDLNSNCVVSVLNRSAEVQPDGSWVLPNVPANIGRVRARATCVENGITRSGQSDYFLIPLSGTVQ